MGDFVGSDFNTTGADGTISIPSSVGTCNESDLDAALATGFMGDGATSNSWIDTSSGSSSGGYGISYDGSGGSTGSDNTSSGDTGATGGDTPTSGGDLPGEPGYSQQAPDSNTMGDIINSFLHNNPIGQALTTIGTGAMSLGQFVASKEAAPLLVFAAAAMRNRQEQQNTDAQAGLRDAQTNYYNAGADNTRAQTTALNNQIHGKVPTIKAYRMGQSPADYGILASNAKPQGAA